MGAVGDDDEAGFLAGHEFLDDDARAAGKYRAWFTGLAPVDKPRIIVAVMVDEPSAGQVYGGLVAAPVFSEVVQQTLRMMNVQPDMAVKPQIVANPVEESL